MQRQSSTTSKASRRVSFHPSPGNEISFQVSEEDIHTAMEEADFDSYVRSLTREISVQSETEDVLLRKHIK